MHTIQTTQKQLSIQFVWFVGVVLMKVVLRSTTMEYGAQCVEICGVLRMLM